MLSRNPTEGARGAVMLRPMRLPALLALSALCLAGPAWSQERTDPDPFVTAVRPILERACVRCHGPERQRRGLRLDSLAALRYGGQHGPAAIPGDPDASLLIRHVEGQPGHARMPHRSPPLPKSTIETLRSWIAAGMPGDDGIRVTPADLGHWAYRPLRRSTIPTGAAATHALDAFVLAQLRPLTDHLAPPASRGRLTRRVWIDLTGLPPSIEELDRVAADEGEDWYERAVDRALASPHFGERWAGWWLDLARYADTKGYEKDDRRSIWRFRDWVIAAFDADMPFDQFTVRQLAGDLLENPTEDDLLATAFHRNTMTNEEGGTDDEEFRVAAVIDRVNTTFEVWMGTTVGCAQCHDHKYDPISQREYYELFAFFNQTADRDRNDEAPTIASPTPEQAEQLAVIASSIQALRARLDAPLPDASHDAWENDLRQRIATYREMAVRFGPWQQATPYAAQSFEQAWETSYPPESGRSTNVQWTPRPDWLDGVVHTDLQGANTAHYLARTVDTRTAGFLELSLGSDDAIRLQIGDRIVSERQITRAVAADQERVRVAVPAGTTRILMKIVNGGGPAGFYFKELGDGVDPALRAALGTARESRTPAEIALLDTAHRAEAPEFATLRSTLANLEKERASMQVATTPIMRELPADAERRTHVLLRGSFLSPGEEVGPGVPARFHPLNDSWPRNRLGLAQWIVDPDNPLTARVTVNRIWEQLFGIGLVETSEDFGQQGEPASHPALLDWLAAEFVEGGWSLKRLLRTIVTSAMYRQDSAVRPELQEMDPRNRLLGHAPAVRLSAESTRDTALALAGILSPKKFGPSVMPYQPDGVWQVVYSGDKWVMSSGEDAHRRGLYTFWRRTSPYPSLVAFDAPSREFCVVRRSRTNTPIQALVTLNDPAFVECARLLALRILREAPADDASRLRYGFRLCTARMPIAAEVDRLQRLLEEERAHFRTASDDARRLVGAPSAHDHAEFATGALAAWTVVANVLLNLDEVLVKR